MHNAGGGKVASVGVGNGVTMDNSGLESNPYVRVGRARLKVSVVSAVHGMGVGKEEWLWRKWREKRWRKKPQ